MFTAFDTEAVLWADGTRERVDAVIFATGYRPNLDYLQPLGALEHGAPKHVGGTSWSVLPVARAAAWPTRLMAEAVVGGVYLQGHRY